MTGPFVGTSEISMKPQRVSILQFLTTPAPLLRTLVHILLQISKPRPHKGHPKRIRLLRRMLSERLVSPTTRLLELGLTVRFGRRGANHQLSMIFQYSLAAVSHGTFCSIDKAFPTSRSCRRIGGRHSSLCAFRVSEPTGFLFSTIQIDKTQKG